jgi:hypothetical protein
MLPDIPAETMAEANKVAKKAFAWRAREDERHWRSMYPGESLDKILAYYDFDYGEAYCFAAWAACEVLSRHGFPSINEKCAYVFWDGEHIEFEEYQ